MKIVHPGCLLVSYCSRQCQKSNWPQHKALCKVGRLHHNFRCHPGYIDMQETHSIYCFVQIATKVRAGGSHLLAGDPSAQVETLILESR